MIFEFSWSWYEDYCPILLEGPEKTEEEFEADCLKAMKESFDAYIEQERSWVQLPIWVEFAAKKLEDYGYKIFRPIHFGCFGLYIPKDDRYDKEPYHDVDEDQFPQFAEQIQRMKDKNNILDNKLHKDIYKQVDKEMKEREDENISD